MILPEREVLALHRAIVGIPSVSGNEAELADFVEERLRQRGAQLVRVGQSVLALHGQGPLLLLDTHLDTVPPVPGWTRDPWQVEVVDGRRHDGWAGMPHGRDGAGDVYEVHDRAAQDEP